MFRRLLCLVTTGLLALSLPACGGSDDKDYRFPVYPAGGTVKFKGAPVGKAVVRFHPEKADLLAMPAGKEGPAVLLTTETTPEGTFAMSTYLADDGVPAGDYVVTVALPQAGEESDVENSDGKPAAPARRTGGPSPRYRDPSTSPLRARVAADAPNRFELILE